MGGLSSHSTSGSQQDDKDADQEVPNDQSRDEDTIDQSQQGVWGILSRFADLDFLRRKRGADLYDDGKADTSCIDGTESLCGSNDINSRDSGGRTPLTVALRCEDENHLIANVTYVLDHPNIDINYPELQQVGHYSYNEVPPLIVATKMGNKQLVELLLKRGALVNATDSEHLSAVYYAAENGDLDLLNLLLTYKPILTSQHDAEDPLHVACRHGYEDVVRLLVEAGADTDPVKDRSTPPILLAAENQHEDICLYLIDHLPIDTLYINERNNLFIRACWFGCPRVAQNLIDRGTDVNILSTSGSSALAHAIRSGDLVRYGQELRRLGDNSPLPVQGQVNASIRRVLRESVSIINVLCDNHADIEHATGMYKMAPLSMGLKAHNIPAVIVLLKHGAIWDSTCDYMFENSNLGRLHKIDPYSFSIVLQFLDNKRRHLYTRTRKSSPNSIRTLKECCRHVIRSRVRRHRTTSTSILPLIRSLPLPPLIKEFLCYSELNEEHLVNQFQVSFFRSCPSLSVTPQVHLMVS